MEEDGMSSIIPTSNEFDIPKDSEIYKEDDEDSDDERERNIVIEDAVDEIFNNVNSEDESSDNISYNKSSEHYEKSSVKISYDPFLSANESCHSSVSQSHLQSDHHNEQSDVSEFEDSKHSGADDSSNHSNDDDTDDKQNNIIRSEINPDTDRHIQQQDSAISFMSDNMSNYQQENRVNKISNISENNEVENILKTSPSFHFKDKYEGLHEEFKKLQLLYTTRGEELEQIKTKEMHTKKISSGKLNL